MLISRRASGKLAGSKPQAAQANDRNKSNSSMPGAKKPQRATKKRKGGSAEDRYKNNS